MHRTLLLVFIHGFKGGDDTFASYPSDLTALLGHALPNVTIRSIVYPQFETRGDLSACAASFRDWLTNKVIDIEVANGTPSPTVDPSVRVILIGHSMGGILAAEVLLGLTEDGEQERAKREHDNEEQKSEARSSLDMNGLMWPYISGILAFDTPYLGLNPGVFAHGAETHYKTAAGAYAALTGALGYSATNNSNSPTTDTDTSPKSPSSFFPFRFPGASSSQSQSQAPGLLPPAETSPTTSNAKPWSRYALIAGAAGAAAAATTAAALFNRDRIGQSWSWATSHLEFVNCLARPAELTSRLDRIISICRSHELGFCNLHTILPDNTRTFCALPPLGSAARDRFQATRNDLAKDEVEAHMCMFDRRKNPTYFGLVERGKDVVGGWILGGEWYRLSFPLQGQGTHEEADSWDRDGKAFQSSNTSTNASMPSYGAKAQNGGVDVDTASHANTKTPDIGPDGNTSIDAPQPGRLPKEPLQSDYPEACRDELQEVDLSMESAKTDAAMHMRQSYVRPLWHSPNPGAGGMEIGGSDLPSTSAEAMWGEEKSAVSSQQ